MLFLAVFCGFLAEYQLEHMIENQREKKFMRSLLGDLKNDTVNFNRSIHVFQYNVERFDSLKSSIKNHSSPEEILNSYKAATLAQSFSSFNYSDRTVEQLRSAGNFRLIRKSMVSDALLDYDKYIRHTYLAIETILEDQSLRLSDMQHQIFDFDIFNLLLTKDWQGRQSFTPDSLGIYLKFVNQDEHILTTYYNSFGSYRNWCQRMVIHSRVAKQQAVELIELIKKEYHLK